MPRTTSTAASKVLTSAAGNVGGHSLRARKAGSPPPPPRRSTKSKGKQRAPEQLPSEAAPPAGAPPATVAVAPQPVRWFGHTAPGHGWTAHEARPTRRSATLPVASSSKPSVLQADVAGCSGAAGPSSLRRMESGPTPPAGGHPGRPQPSPSGTSGPAAVAVSHAPVAERPALGETQAVVDSGPSRNALEECALEDMPGAAKRTRTDADAELLLAFAAQPPIPRRGMGLLPRRTQVFLALAAHELSKL